jgi:hypothetical protein
MGKTLADMVNGLLEILMKLCSSQGNMQKLKNKLQNTSKDGFKFFLNMNPTTCQMISWFFEGILKLGIPFLLTISAFYIYRK